MRRWFAVAVFAAAGASWTLLSSLDAAAEPTPPAAEPAATSSSAPTAEPSAGPATQPPPETEPAATPVPVPAPTPAPVRAEPRPLQPDVPQITPWAWPFAWMQDAERQKAEQERAAAAVSSPAAQAAASGVPRNPGSTGSARASVVPLRSPDAAAPAGVAEEQLPSVPGAPQPDVPGTDPLQRPQPTAVLGQGGGNVLRSCEPRAIENSVASDRGAIMQVAVQNSDCTWSAAQVLVSYDIRGPPTVDVLSQSAGLSTNVGVNVASNGKVTVRFGYVGPNGAFTDAAPVVLDPLVQANQTGDNRIEVSQDAATASGDAMSGVQKVAVSIDQDAAAVHVLAQNASPGASAASGDATAGNVAGGVAGPVANGVVADAQAGQIGDNDVIVDQDAHARSGDAEAGTQQIEVWVSGSVGEVAILASNASPRAFAVSGDAVATNTASAAAGPDATSMLGDARAGQVGDNRIDVDQTAFASTGDAVAGSQVIGVVIGGDAGRVAVLASNDSRGAFASSGDAVAVNTAAATTGPTASALIGDASAAQVGDNRIEVDQTASASTGDAVAGSQVIGIVIGGQAGQTAVLAGNDAAAALALSGAAAPVNIVGGHAGPVSAATGVAVTQQSGRNVVDVTQALDGTSGDAVAGAQVVGTVQAQGGLLVAGAAPEADRQLFVTTLAALAA